MALAGGFVAVSAAPAQAADPTVQVVSVSSTTVEAGGKTTIKYSVTNNNNLGVPGNNRIQINVNGGMSCGGDCSPAANIDPGQSQEFTAELTAPALNAGQNRTVRITISAQLGRDRGTATETIEVRGPEKPKNVRQISGRVRDGKGKAIGNARVIMQDSADHRYETESDGDGGYSFTSSDSKPIAPGAISVGAGKDGFEPAAVNVQAAADKTVNVPLTLTSKTAPTPSATPTTAEETTPPADETTDETTEAASAPPAGDANRTAGEDDGNGSLLFIILGGLLVAAGIGAIVLVLMRRKGNNDDDFDKGGLPAGGPPPVGRGGYPDATRVAAPVGGGRANDATMIAGAGAMADAPTVLQRAVPVEDEFPDPYGVPAQPQHTYGGHTQTYGATQVPAQGGAGYDDGYYDDGQPAAQQGYYGGAPAAQPRYDEPTGMYRPDDYADADGGYQAPQQQARPGGGTYGGAYQQSWDEAPAYGQQPGGGQGGAAGSYGAGYDAGAGGYDYDNGGYDAGYDQRGGAAYQAAPQQGYSAGGYEAGGYDPGYDQGGYDPRGGEQGGYYGGAPRQQPPPPPEEPARPGQRRLPWTDE